MKKQIYFLQLIFILFSTLFTGAKCFAQTPNWLWAQGLRGDSWDDGNGISHDLSGNIYVTGGYQSSKLFVENDSLVNSDTASYSADMFLIKYSPAGNVIWKQTFAGMQDNYGFAICNDDSANIYVTCIAFGKTFSIGGNTFNNADTSGNSTEAFIIKLDSSGTVRWVRNVSGRRYDYLLGICIDANGYVYATGHFQSRVLYIENDSLVNSTSNGSNFFVVKYDLNGNYIWSTRGGGNYWTGTYKITVDQNGDAYVAGEFGDSVFYFANDTLLNQSMPGYDDYFVAKIDHNGNPVWAKSAGGPEDEYGGGLIADGFGNLYVTGGFYSDSVDFGAGYLLNSGSWELFLLKYDLNGQVVWSKAYGGSGSDNVHELKADSLGALYMAGQFASPMLMFGTSMLMRTGNENAFITKFDSDGNPVWAQNTSGSISENVLALTVDANRNVYSTGTYHSNPATFGTSQLVNLANTDVFVAKLEAINTGTPFIRPNNLSAEVFPNPSANFISIHFAGEPDFSNSLVFRMYNFMGEKVMERRLNSVEEQLNLDVESGVYTYEVRGEKEFYGKGKVVVVR